MVLSFSSLETAARMKRFLFVALLFCSAVSLVAGNEKILRSFPETMADLENVEGVSVSREYVADSILQLRNVELADNILNVSLLCRVEKDSRRYEIYRINSTKKDLAASQYFLCLYSDNKVYPKILLISESMGMWEKLFHIVGKQVGIYEVLYVGEYPEIIQKFYDLETFDLISRYPKLEKWKWNEDEEVVVEEII